MSPAAVMPSVLAAHVRPAPTVRVRVSAPDPEARAWCGTLLSAHSSKCVDCHDRRLERRVLAMGGSDHSVFHTRKDGSIRRSYLFLPNAALVAAGFRCTWDAKSSLTAALLDYIRGYRDWCNQMLGEVQA